MKDQAGPTPEDPSLASDATQPAGEHPNRTVCDTAPAKAAHGIEATRPAMGQQPGDLPELPTVDRAVYEVGAEVAKGGMGRVLSARDRRAGRPVALKELLASSSSAKARFEREAKITARLQHPSIVPIYEVGRWPDGEPFFAMKHVEGKSLDKVIAETTTIKDRLALLPNVLAVADALAYSHSRRIIHRDLKPANILVGAFGETVVIDWGLAKDLAAAKNEVEAGDDRRTVLADDGLTVAGYAMGTPAFMPPEQARGEAVDERADVYSIGATLHHLLCGGVPYGESKGIDALVKEGPPKPLRAVAPEVPADLLAVIDKAMARDPADRYATAKELADDLRRFQTGQLVGVHRYTTRQLARRWLRRHRTAVSVAAAAMMILGIGGVIGFWRVVQAKNAAETQRVVAEKNLAEAEQSRADAEELMDFMLGDLHEKLQPLGKSKLLGVVASKAKDYYQRRPEDRGSNERRRRALARRNLGDVLLAQGDAPGARAEFRASLAIAEALAASEPSNAVWQRNLSVSHNKVGDVLAQGDAPGALAEFRASLAISEKLAASDPRNAGWQRDLSVSREYVGDVLLAQGDAPGALAEFRASLTISEKLAASDPSNAGWQRDLSVSRESVGDVLLAQGEAPGALADFRASLAIREALAASDPSNAVWQRDLMVGHYKLGTVILAQGDAPGALAEYRASLAIAETRAGKDPTDATRRDDVAELRHVIATCCGARR